VQYLRKFYENFHKHYFIIISYPILDPKNNENNFNNLKRISLNYVFLRRFDFFDLLKLFN